MIPEAAGSNPVGHPRRPGTGRNPPPVPRASASVITDAPLAQRQSNGLLIRRFWVRIPGGAPLHGRSMSAPPSRRAFHLAPSPDRRPRRHSPSQRTRRAQLSVAGLRRRPVLRPSGQPTDRDRRHGCRQFPNAPSRRLETGQAPGVEIRYAQAASTAHMRTAVIRTAVIRTAAMGTTPRDAPRTTRPAGPAAGRLSRRRSPASSCTTAGSSSSRCTWPRCSTSRGAWGWWTTATAP